MSYPKVKKLKKERKSLQIITVLKIDLELNPELEEVHFGTDCEVMWDQ